MTFDGSVPAAARGQRRLADGLIVTRLGYGAMQLPGPGIWGPPTDRDAAIAVLRRAVDLGLTHIDTSDAYGPRVANELIRQALHPYRQSWSWPPRSAWCATRGGPSRLPPSPRPSGTRSSTTCAGSGWDRLDLVHLRVGGDGLSVPDDVPLVECRAPWPSFRVGG